MEATELLRRYGLTPKRSLAQNFLIDETHLARIAAAADLTPDDVVLEIGPGLGGLTQYLAAQAGRVIAVELDNRLIELLRQRFADQPQVEIVHGDILELNPAVLVGDVEPADWRLADRQTYEMETGATIQNPKSKIPNPYKVVANLPYYITSAVLRHLLEAQPPPTLVVVLVQKEVAERICAQPGDMSLLAVSVQYYAQPRLVHRVPAGAFQPRPKVDSAVLRLDVRPQPAVVGVEPDFFFQVVRAGFAQKRKQLVNPLSAGLALPKAQVSERLQQAGIDPQRRAETLSLDEWGALCGVLRTE